MRKDVSLRYLHFLALACLLLANRAVAGVLYVDLGSTNPVSPFATWATAATNIQDAIDAAVAGDQVLVTNGIYQTGGRVVSPYLLTNRIVVDKPIMVQSVNGPGVTIIKGFQVPVTTNGDAAVRGAYLAAGATLAGFTISNGATRASGNFTNELYGGGIRCESTSAVVSNCIVVGCFATTRGGGVSGASLFGSIISNNVLSVGGNGAGVSDCIVVNCSLIGNRTQDLGHGGGAYRSTLTNCLIIGNYAHRNGGGADSSTLNNCVVAGNSVFIDGGGGTWGSILTQCNIIGNSGDGDRASKITNCIIYFNKGQNIIPGSSGTVEHCCTTPLPSIGSGNITNQPQLADLFHLSPFSPCIYVGAQLSPGQDIDGEAWAVPPSIGCDEYYPGAAVGPLVVAIQANNVNVLPGSPLDFVAQISGHPSLSVWDFGDGVIVSNTPCVSRAWTNPGDYVVTLTAFNDSNPAGIATNIVVHVLQYFVARNNPTPVAPYTTWATAATNIQDAIDVAFLPGVTVMVSNGVYDTGGRVIFGAMTNRVAINKPIRVQSVNGPSVTVIQGFQVPGTKVGPAAIRCAYVTNRAVLSGFTLTGGATLSTGDIRKEKSGGGVFAEPTVNVFGDPTNAVIENCLIISNWAATGGGGACNGLLRNCSVISNLAESGGGLTFSYGVGCLIVGNHAGINSPGFGGGAETAFLTNCTVVGNSAGNMGSGGGVNLTTVYSSILYYNSASFGSNYTSGTFNYSCVPSEIGGIAVGNITNAPLFVNMAGGDFRLQSNSPCINSGFNVSGLPFADLDGNARIVGGTVDMGAYEYPAPSSIISYAWLQQFGLPSDGSADFADADGDQMNNWQEWRAGTVPTNSASSLMLLNPVPTGSNVVLTWQSASNRSYYLQRATNLTPPIVFSPIATNFFTQGTLTSYTNTNVTGPGPFYYRVGVQ